MVVVVARVLDRHPPDPVAGERAQHEVDPLAEADADHDPLGVGDRAPDPAQVPGEHLAQGLGAARIAVPELARGGVAAAVAHRPGPVGAREAREVGDAGKEVDREARRGSRPRRLRVEPASGDGAGASAPAATRVAEPVREVRNPSAWSWL